MILRPWRKQQSPATIPPEKQDEDKDNKDGKMPPNLEKRFRVTPRVLGALPSSPIGEKHNGAQQKGVELRPRPFVSDLNAKAPLVESGD
jgi:hypothetical protein